MVSLRIGRSLARGVGAKLMILGVAVPQAHPESEPSDIDQIARLPSHLEEMASAIVDVPVEYRIEQGEPGPVIVKVANKIGADMIVMGMRGRGNLPWMRMGSITEYVTRHATCPVLAVTEGQAARTTGVAESTEPSTITLSDLGP